MDTKTLPTRSPMPKVVVFGLASCFGCQLQIANDEKHLMDVLGQMDLQYWQLVSDQPLPQEFDVAIIEGAVTTAEAVDLVKEIRERAAVVITIGACAETAGIPGLALSDFERDIDAVYGDNLPAACGEITKPVSVGSIIQVDFAVHCCPIDTASFIDVLQRVLYGSNKSALTTTMCGQCKINERPCLYSAGQICMGLVTRAGCHAKCPNLGRPCNGCAGLSPDANIESAVAVVQSYGLDADEFMRRLELFNADALSPETTD